MPLARFMTALLFVVALALPAAAGAQTPVPTQALPAQGSGSSRPPVQLGGSGERSSGGGTTTRAKRALPDTGSDPRLLLLAGLALTLLGLGLRLRTADADVF